MLLWKADPDWNTFSKDLGLLINKAWHNKRGSCHPDTFRVPLQLEGTNEALTHAVPSYGRIEFNKSESAARKRARMARAKYLRLGRTGFHLPRLAHESAANGRSADVPKLPKTLDRESSENERVKASFNEYAAGIRARRTRKMDPAEYATRIVDMMMCTRSKPQRPLATWPDAHVHTHTHTCISECVCMHTHPSPRGLSGIGHSGIGHSTLGDPPRWTPHVYMCRRT